MSQDDLKDLVEKALPTDELSKMFNDPKIDTDQVLFWLPVEYKQKFSRLNKSSKFEFGKKIKDVIMMCIDRAEKFDSAS